MQNNENNESKVHSSNENSSSIRFKRKKAKSNIRLGGKLVFFFVLAGVSGAFFSSIIMDTKYGNIIYQAKIVEKNQNMMINDYSRMIKNASPSLVSISGEEKNLLDNNYHYGNTTGIIIDETGSILTNYSSIKDKNDIYVKLASKGIMPIKATFVIGDEEMDIAIIKIHYDGKLYPIKLSKMDTIEEGQQIAILSNSIGDDYIGSVMPGMITSTNSKIKVSNSEEHSLIEINAPINKENNGGAVCNSKGELIGVASEKITSIKALNGVYYATSIDRLDKMINYTNVFKRTLGITGGTVINKGNKELSGFYVESVLKDRNAHNSGIKPTDIIFRMDDRDIKNSEDILNVLNNKKPGDLIKCKVKRNDKILDVNIKL